jgi:phosphatidylserine/phosphatidylglycerophosphate/cardiolipin synthase-like enzyme
MKALLSLLIFVSLYAQSQAEVSVMFHPRDPSLDQIAEHILHAQEQIDMALYNIETSDRNPVIKALKSDEVQAKIQSGKIDIRIIFEGFGSDDDNHQRMKDLEELGVDARYLGVSKKMHHKFATIDAHSNKAVLITGSANWSLSSKNHYNENILFFEDHPGITQAFQSEFDNLWNNSKEFGFSKDYIFIERSVFETEEIEAFFNTEHFDVENGFRRIGGYKFTLTRELIKSIEKANHSIDIATTRIKLRPVYEALIQAAARGVRINAVVTMGEYKSYSFRKNKDLKVCEHIFEKSCSTSQNFAIFLEREDYEGKENVEVRYKYFDLRSDQYLREQMHSKYMIIDGKEVLTGSFNWSISSEYNHIENLLRLNEDSHPGLVSEFEKDFSIIWDLNRDKYLPTYDQIARDLETKGKTRCALEAMTLKAEEIDRLRRKYKKGICL